MKKNRTRKIVLLLSIVIPFALLNVYFFNNGIFPQGVPDELDVTNLPSKIAKSTNQKITVTAKSGGLVDEDYGGKVVFTSTDTLASLPSDYTFKNGSKEKAMSVNGWDDQLKAHQYSAIADELSNNDIDDVYLGVFETVATGTQAGLLFCENDYGFGGVTSDNNYDLTDFINAAASQSIDTYAWITVFGPEQTLDYDGDGRLEYTWVDPASSEHETFINNLISHLLTNYGGLAGIVVDYIRYADPPDANENDGDNIDEAQYRVYKDGGTHTDYTGNFAPGNATEVISSAVGTFATTMTSFPTKELIGEVYPAHTQSLYDDWVKPHLGQDYASLAVSLDKIVPMAYHIGWYPPTWVGQVVDFVYGKVNPDPANPVSQVWPKVQTWQDGKSIVYPGPGEIAAATDSIDYTKVGGLGFYVFDHTSPHEWTEVEECFDDDGIKTFDIGVTFNQNGTYNLKAEDTVAGISHTQNGIEVFLGHANGTVAITASDPAVYYIKDGYKSRILSPTVFLSRFRWSEIVTISDAEMSNYQAYPTEPNLHYRDGTLFRLYSAPEVYVVEDGQKRWIDSAATFTSKGYSWSNIKLAESQAVLDAHTTGSDLTGASPYPNGTLLVSQSDARVYFLENGFRRPIISPTVFLSQFRWNELISASEVTLESWGIGEQYQYREGSIIKNPASAHIYYIDGPLKRHFPNATVYLGLGYDWGDYVTAESSSVLDYLTEGDGMWLLAKYFTFYGDTRWGHTPHQQIVNQMIAQKPFLTFHVGDLIQDCNSQSDWDMFNFIVSTLRQMVTFYPSIGNHDNCSKYFDNFNLPNNEKWYSVEYDKMHFIALDSMEALTPGSEQYNWLHNDLDAISADINFRIVYFHYPLLSNAGYIANLAPLFEAHDVDIVFQGHQHNYERAQYHGIYYIVTGGGGAPLSSGKTNPTYVQEWFMVYHFTRLLYEDNKLKVDAIDINGDVIDHFEVDA